MEPVAGGRANQAAGGAYHHAVLAFKRQLLQDALARASGNQTRPAQLLGLQPGGRLPAERDLARRMGVGRPALREALQLLQAAGLVGNGVTGRGWRVRDGEGAPPRVDDPIGAGRGKRSPAQRPGGA